VQEVEAVQEDMTFALPRELRPPAAAPGSAVGQGPANHG